MPKVQPDKLQEPEDLVEDTTLDPVLQVKIRKQRNARNVWRRKERRH